MTTLFTPERDGQLLASLHWTMARKAARHARHAREFLEVGGDELPSEVVDRYEEDMSECRRIARVLAKA